jgi:hypothetical protein
VQLSLNLLKEVLTAPMNSPSLYTIQAQASASHRAWWWHKSVHAGPKCRLAWLVPSRHGRWIMLAVRIKPFTALPPRLYTILNTR